MICAGFNRTTVAVELVGGTDHLVWLNPDLHHQLEP